MLISHIHRFIYLKTVKTGGTSVEIYFERYCTDPNRNHEERHERDPEISKWGIIGARGRAAKGQIWRHHMAANEIRQLIGSEMWESYYKFCVVRNPFDKVVSWFWHMLGEQRAALKQADFKLVRGCFLQWLPTADFPPDRAVMTIHGVPVANRFVRYETLLTGLESVCRDLGLPWEPERLGRYKSEFRLRQEHFSEYYDPAAASLVHTAYRWEFDYFGYPAGPTA